MNKILIWRKMYCLIYILNWLVIYYQMVIYYYHNKLLKKWKKLGLKIHYFIFERLK